MGDCPTCDTAFSSLGTHFQWNPDHRPELSDRQREIVEYLILRGANVRDDGAKPRLEVFSTKRWRLASVADALGWLANSPRRHVAAGNRASDSTASEGEADGEATDPASSDMWAFTSVPHPSLAYDGPTDVAELRPLTARLILAERATWVGTLFGSLHVDLRGFDVDGDHLRTLLRREGVATVEYDGDGYAEDTHTARYHWHPDVVAVPHYDALELLEWAGMSLSDVAD
jgi:hypothetical protein